MFTEFSKILCQKLIEQDYYIISADSDSLLTEETPCIILVRNQSPVLYAVNVINTSVVTSEKYEQLNSNFCMQIEEMLNNFYCSHAIVLNLLVCSEDSTQAREFANSREIITGEKINCAWWVADLMSKQLYFAMEQPTKILNYSDIINTCLKGYEQNEYNCENIKTMEHTHRQKTAINVKSNNYYITIALILINVIIYMAVHFTKSENVIFDIFANNSAQVLNNHQYYRLFTSMFLHGSFMHVAYNCLSLYIFGSRLEPYLGKARYLSIYFLSGLLGSIASVFLTAGISVGASGAIFGLTGAMIAFSYYTNREVGGLNYPTILLFGIMGIGLGFLDVGVDNFAHLGGIAGGLLFEGIFIHMDKKKALDKKSYPQ